MHQKNFSPIDQAISQLLDRTEELISLDKLDDAERFLAEILKHKPDELNVPFQRGTLFSKKGEYNNALEQFLIVYDKLPGHFENLNNIATAYFKLQKYDEAIDFYKKALEIMPKSSFVMSALAVCLSRHGRVDEAINYFRQSLAIAPDMPSVHSDLLLTMIYAESVSPEELAEEAKLFGKNIAVAFPRKNGSSRDKTSDRKLKIGYISPDFKDHPVPYFVESLFRNHNRDHFQIYAYSNTHVNNVIMDRIKFCVDVWRDIRKFDAAAIHDLIVEDQIDILVDLSGHTGHNNLKVFAYKPAPVQVTWLGFPATTGMETIDYRITDTFAEPPGMTEHLSIEKLWRLPHIFCCYMPHEYSPNVVEKVPFEDNGYITFGCFNNFMKVRDPVLATWKKILDQVPNSCLLLEVQGINHPKFRDAVLERLKQQGIPTEQVILEPRSNANQFVLYNKIDIALDPFPCVGGTTSFDTLWMGVPFVTLAGKQFVSRMGVTILNNAGLPELIAQNTDEYIAIAVAIATDQARLRELRRGLRDRFSRSPAMDQELFARDMEEAYRGMWQEYCRSND